MSGLRLLYGHGFASGPGSAKGRALARHLAERGHALVLLDLRIPTRDRFRLSAMIEATRAAIGDAPRAIAIGSSLGGLTMARAAERDARIVGTVLLAPAFRVVERWRPRVGEEDWAKWQREGTMLYDDHATGGKVAVDFGFIEDAERVDVGWPDVKVETTIIHGVHDETVDPAMSRTYASTRPHVKLVEVDDDHQLLKSMPVICAEVDAMILKCQRAQ